jgi:hypothetical protein
MNIQGEVGIYAKFATSKLRSNWVAMPTDPKAAYPLSTYDSAGKNGYVFAPWTSQ